MTYEKIVEKIKKAYAKADSSAVEGHKAIQINVRGEGEGALYIEASEGKFNVQPYEYYDNDAVVTVQSKVLLDIIDGSIEPEDAYNAQKLSVIGDASAAKLILSLRTVNIAKKTYKKAEDAAKKAAKAAKPMAEKAVKAAKPMAEKAFNETKKGVKKAAATAEKAIKAAAKAVKEEQTAAKAKEEQDVTKTVNEEQDAVKAEDIKIETAADTEADAVQKADEE